MRQQNEPDGPRLCNSCEVRENIRNPKGKEMQTVGILIQVPKETQIEIEEYCIANGKDFSKYFLELHLARKALSIETTAYPTTDECSTKEEEKPIQNKVKKK
jgi:hypothetical protein